jgi:hypothetical protein
MNLREQKGTSQAETREQHEGNRKAQVSGLNIVVTTARYSRFLSLAFPIGPLDVP